MSTAVRMNCPPAKPDKVNKIKSLSSSASVSSSEEATSSTTDSNSSSSLQPNNNLTKVPEPKPAQPSKDLLLWIDPVSYTHLDVYKRQGEYKIYGYLDFHSYSQEILYPYAYSCEALPRDLENLLELSYGLAKAIRNKSGKTYDVLSSCEDRGSDLTPGLGSGSALDYMYHHRAHWAFQLKLRDTGNHGFLLPPKYITPVGKEAYAALKYFCDFILNPEL